MKKHIFLASLLSAFTLPVMADNFYVFGDAGQGKFEVDSSNNSTLSKTETTFSFGAGYEFNKFLAVELAYRDLGNLTDRSSDFDSKGDYSYIDKLSVTAVQASVVGKLPITDEFNFFGRVGVADIDADSKSTQTYSNTVTRDSSSDSKTRAVFGLGASYDVSSQLAVRAEYNQYAKWDDLKLSSFTVGAVYKF